MRYASSIRNRIISVFKLATVMNPRLCPWLAGAGTKGLCARDTAYEEIHPSAGGWAVCFGTWPRRQNDACEAAAVPSSVARTSTRDGAVQVQCT